MMNRPSSNRIVIVGASSGIGREVALLYIASGWTVGVAARRTEALQELRAMAPERVFVQPIDVSSNEAVERLTTLLEQMGGMDVFLNCAGVGRQNHNLDTDVELATAQVNVDGFLRMITTAYRWMAQHNGGHIVVISSIAGTRGLGVAPAYSATKRFQNCYIDSLAQLSHMEHAGVKFTDLRPGFVATDLLSSSRRYPMLMRPAKVAQLIVRAIDRRQRVAVIDWRYAILVSLWRLIPRFVWERLPIRN